MKKLLQNVVGRAWLEGDPSKDRTVGLVVFGTLEILLGIFCFAVAMLLLVGVSVSGLHGIKPTHYWMAMSFLFYLTACGYPVWVRDCFRSEKVAVEVKSYQQRKAEEQAATPEEPPRPRMRLD
jgi:hypothetical protein